VIPAAGGQAGMLVETFGHGATSLASSTPRDRLPCDGRTLIIESNSISSSLAALHIHDGLGEVPELLPSNPP
jgi:hypothetical protein